MKKPFKWLERKIALPAPFMTLVRTEKDYLTAMRHCKVDNPSPWVPSDQSACAHCFEHAEDGHCVVVALSNDGLSGVETACLLVHEAVHVAQYYFKSISEHCPAEEQQAYAIQILSQTLMMEYIRQTT